jgi:hypothetical protein
MVFLNDMPREATTEKNPNIRRIFRSNRSSPEVALSSTKFWPIFLPAMASNQLIPDFKKTGYSN